MERTNELIARAADIRRRTAEMLFCAGGGHYGGCFSVIDILTVLYHEILRFDKKNARSPTRDRLILSKGHSAAALYSTLMSVGLVDDMLLSSYGKFESPLEGHPDMTKSDWIDFSTGSLGQGLSIGMGFAFALKKTSAEVWVVLGDGECQEGQIWESAILASRYGLGSLRVVIDANQEQEFGWKHDKMLSQYPIAQMYSKWAAFGWEVVELDGHDLTTMRDTFHKYRGQLAAPVVFIANTIKGKGCLAWERQTEPSHCVTLSQEAQSRLLCELAH